MHKIKVLAIISLALTSILIAFSGSHATSSTGGYTSAPGDGVCAQCHTDNNTSLDGEYSITGIPKNIEANTTYTVEVQLTNPSGNALRGGFQILALDENNAQGGTWSNAGAGSILKTVAGKTYLGHHGSQVFPDDNELNWTAEWTSPDKIASTLNFYAVSILANGANGNQNDRFFIQQFDATIPDVLIPLTIHIDLISNATCELNNDGIASVNISGGIQPYSILWDNGDTTITTTTLSIGNTNVLVIDSNGEITNDSVTITSIDTIPPIIELQDLVMYADSTGFNDIPAFLFDYASIDNCSEVSFEYLTPPMIGCDFASPQILSVIGSDSSDNRDTVEVTLILTDTISPWLSEGLIDMIEQVDCEPLFFDFPIFIDNCSDTLTIEQLAGFENGETFPIGVTEQIYSITDMAGNQVIYSFTVSITSDLSAVITSNDTNCFNEATGSVDIEVAGIHAAYIQDSTILLTGLATGSYTVTIIDTIGCKIIETININEPSELNAQINITSASSNNTLDGEIEIIVDGGISPYTIQLFDTIGNELEVSSTGIFTNISSGIYNARLTDTNGCELNIEIIEVPAITSTIDLFEQYDVQSYPNPVTDQLNISTTESKNLDISISTIEGQTIFMGQLKTAMLAIDLSEQAAGLYILTISNQKYTTARTFSIIH